MPFCIERGKEELKDAIGLIWYIQNKTPLSLTYLEACMHQAGNLQPHEKLTREIVIELVKEKAQKIDWESAKSDIRIFISDPDNRLKIWSPTFFSTLIEKLIVE